MSKIKKTQNTDSQLHDPFGLELSKTLQLHTEPVYKNFTKLVLERLDTIRTRKILRTIIIQERLALAGCILLTVAAGIFVVAFPYLIPSALNSAGNLIKSAAGKILSGDFSFDWQNLLLILASAAVAVYYILDLQLDQT